MLSSPLNQQNCLFVRTSLHFIEVVIIKAISVKKELKNPIINNIVNADSFSTSIKCFCITWDEHNIADNAKNTTILYILFLFLKTIIYNFLKSLLNLELIYKK